MKRKIFLVMTAMMTSAGVVLAADASATWNQHCASCHGKDGSGSTTMGKKLNVKDYREAAVQGAFTDAEAAKAIKEGVKKDGKEKMKPYGGKLSDADITALVVHVRSLKK